MTKDKKVRWRNHRTEGQSQIPKTDKEQKVTVYDLLDKHCDTLSL